MALRRGLRHLAGVDGPAVESRRQVLYAIGWMAAIGRILIVTGILLVVAGVLLIGAGHIPWVGRLPGDIYIKRDNFTFYFPLMTCLLISVALAVLIYPLRR